MGRPSNPANPLAIALVLVWLVGMAGCSSGPEDKKEARPQAGERNNEEKGAGLLDTLTQIKESKELVAKISVKTLTMAAETYALNNDGNMPPSLDALTAVQPNGGKPLVPADALIDPWGKHYQYDPSGRRNQGFKPDVWAATPEGKTIGNWPEGK